MTFLIMVKQIIKNKWSRQNNKYSDSLKIVLKSSDIFETVLQFSVIKPI